MSSPVTCRFPLLDCVFFLPLIKFLVSLRTGDRTHPCPLDVRVRRLSPLLIRGSIRPASEFFFATSLITSSSLPRNRLSVLLLWLIYSPLLQKVKIPKILHFFLFRQLPRKRQPPPPHFFFLLISFRSPPLFFSFCFLEKLSG